jgi:hypothetical protein
MTIPKKHARGSSGSSPNELFPPESLTDEALRRSSPPTSEASSTSTSSPGSEGGRLPPSLLVGLPTDPYGPDPVPVSLFRRRGGGKVPTIHGICGPTSFASSAPSGLLLSWENKLRARLATVGSTEFALIWEVQTTPAGLSISRLRPWTPHRSDSASIGRPSTWPAVTAEINDGDPEKKDRRRTELKAKHGSKTGNGMGVGTAEMMRRAAWPIVQASTAEAGHASRGGDRKDELLLLGMLRENARAVWSTVRASDGEKGSPNQSFGAGGEPLVAQIHKAATWSAPKPSDERSPAASRAMDPRRRNLNDQQAAAAAWVAPSARDWKDSPGMAFEAEDGRRRDDQLPRQMCATEAGGPISDGSSVTTASSAGSPTPRFPCWLQGYPAMWLRGAASATASSRRQRRKSSPPSSK